MNEQLSNYAKNFLKEGLSKCTEGEQHRFKQMYANGNFNLSIEEVVDNMPDEKLDWAMQQVQSTLDKKDRNKDRNKVINMNDNPAKIIFNGMERYLREEYIRVNKRLKRRNYRKTLLQSHVLRVKRLNTLDEGRLLALKDAGHRILLTNISKPEK